MAWTKKTKTNPHFGMCFECPNFHLQIHRAKEDRLLERASAAARWCQTKGRLSKDCKHLPTLPFRFGGATASLKNWHMTLHDCKHLSTLPFWRCFQWILGAQEWCQRKGPLAKQMKDLQQTQIFLSWKHYVPGSDEMTTFFGHASRSSRKAWMDVSSSVFAGATHMTWGSRQASFNAEKRWEQ